MENYRSARDKALGADFQTEVQVSAATTLTPTQRNVLATIPLAAANDYSVTLPPVGECEDGARFLIRGVRASGSYVDGGVDVLAAGDEDRTTTIVADKMTASTDLVLVECVMGRYWRQLQDITT
jgi:hypothetical protein